MLDEQLVQLLNERALLALAIGRYKRSRTLPVGASGRELQVLDGIARLNSGPLDQAALGRIFAGIIAECRGWQVETCGDEYRP